MKSINKPVVVIPNWNGADDLAACLESLLAQSVAAHIIVVDNGSVDGSLALLEAQYPAIELIKHATNLGYTGGVNPGFQRAIELGAKYVAPFNNDAVADINWLKQLVQHLDAYPAVGIAACKVLDAAGTALDSTGDYYTSWGLPHPRGRDETDTNKYDNDTTVFGASGAASLYRVSMLETIGLLDQDFFAYYEDVDLSFRAQLAGWKIDFVPTARVYHATSTTSRKIKGFTTYQTIKNYPWLLVKDVPLRYWPHIVPRFTLAYCLFIASAFQRGQGWYALKGFGRSLLLLPKKLAQRHHIQINRQVSDAYIWGIITHDLPPNAHKLRALRASWWRLTRRKI